MKYKFGTLRPDISPEAEAHNSALLGPSTLGFEVTIQVLAERCGLGNIDLQHGEHPTSTSSVIEEALELPLPPEGSTFVTVRPDRDSLGAMAVVTLRAEGRRVDCWLVAWIGLVDGVGFHRAKELRPELMPRDGKQADAMQTIINDKERWPTTEKKVAAIADILDGTMTRSEIDQIASLKEKSLLDFQVELYGQVALITAPGQYIQARNWGNKNYPIALVFDPKFRAPDGNTRERWTLVRQEGYFDRNGFETAINIDEANAQGISLDELKKQGFGWGGTPCIVSQSQRKCSALNNERIIARVLEHAESGIVS